MAWHLEICCGRQIPVLNGINLLNDKLNGILVSTFEVDQIAADTPVRVSLRMFWKTLIPMACAKI